MVPETSNITQNTDQEEVLQSTTNKTDLRESPAWLKDGSKQSLHINFIRCKRLSRWVLNSILGVSTLIGLMAFFHFLEISPVVQAIVGISWLLLMAFLAWTAQFWPAIAYRYRSFRVSDAGIEIKEGVFWQSVIHVPTSRMQHTDVNQGPIERKFGLSHLVIHTAGTTSASVTLGGIGYKTAIELRDHLIESEHNDEL